MIRVPFTPQVRRSLHPMLHCFTPFGREQSQATSEKDEDCACQLSDVLIDVESNSILKVDDGPTPMESMSGTAVPLASAPKVYCMQYFPEITCARLSGRTSTHLSGRVPRKQQ